MHSLLLKLSTVFMLILMHQTIHANGINKAPVDKKTWQLQCFGTEPFWSFSLGKKGFVFETPDTQKVTFNSAKPRYAHGVPQKTLFVYTTKTPDGKKTATLVVKKNKGGCSDGMSDNKYPYDAVLIFSDKILSGCCKK